MMIELHNLQTDPRCRTIVSMVNHSHREGIISVLESNLAQHIPFGADNFLEI